MKVEKSLTADCEEKVIARLLECEERVKLHWLSLKNEMTASVWGNRKS
jgi:hypothetical protein